MPVLSTLEDLLMLEHSRRNTDLVSGLILQKPEIFDQLMELFLRNEEPVSRRAAWVIDSVSEEKEDLLQPYVPDIIAALPGFKHDGMKRHSLRMIARSDIPDRQTGELMNICFEWLLSPHEAVAAKVYCIDILYRLSQTEPDLKTELADSIEWRLNEESPGFRNHGAKVLAKLYNEMK